MKIDKLLISMATIAIIAIAIMNITWLTPNGHGEGCYETEECQSGGQWCTRTGGSAGPKTGDQVGPGCDGYRSLNSQCGYYKGNSCGYEISTMAKCKG